MLVMLPYPSGRIHMGHVRNYTLGDVVARFRRMRGDQVMHPLGWDSFGLPAENAAIKNGIHPAVWTRANIQEMKGQIQKMGISYDWDREIATFLPEYYRWNQWFFLKMWERGDVFRALRNVNWCEALGTVLANEQVVDGKDERTGHPVVQKPMEQYFFAITRYAEELLADKDQLDWPENVKAMQRHWIGKSEGARLDLRPADGAAGAGVHHPPGHPLRGDLHGAVHRAPLHPEGGRRPTRRSRPSAPWWPPRAGRSA